MGDTVHDKQGIMVMTDVRDEANKVYNLSAHLIEEGKVAARMARDGVLATREADERFGFNKQELRVALRTE